MEDRTCPVCATQFAPRTWNQKYCTGSRGKCYRRATNAAFRAQREAAVCPQCGLAFERSRSSQQRYCTDECHCTAKRERYSGPVKARAAWPPTRGRKDLATYRRAVRNDPCAYCGDRPSNGVDHIEPTGATGDRADWTNWTGCCKRCNETKRALPLLLALPWIPLSRTYHDRRRLLFAP